MSRGNQIVGLIVLTLALVVGALGCKAPAGVVKAIEDMRVPVIAMADRYAALVNKTTNTSDAQKFAALQLVQKDLEQFEGLHSRTLEWAEGKDIFSIDQAVGYYKMFEELREKLKEDDD